MKSIYQKQEHAQSYYAATAGERTPYPSLEGVSTALDLAERAYSASHLMSEIISDGVAGILIGMFLESFSAVIVFMPS